MIALQFQNVSKQFRIGEQHRSLTASIGYGLRRLFQGKPAGTGQSFLAVDDVSFDLAPGEALGIIGPNGAGKSTVLKLLAGILRPDAGAMVSRGRKAALIEVGAGFHGDLTGRENIYLNATLIGMGRAEIRRKLDAIVSFAGVERFLDTPVKRYSSGMYARLGFSIAAHVDPDILLVDEVLSVGDALFRVRCLDRMRQLVQKGTALVFVTHDLEQMRSICGRCIVLEQGKASFDGTPSAAVGEYLTAMSRCCCARPGDLPAAADTREIAIENVVVRDGFGDDVSCIGPDHFAEMEIPFHFKGQSRTLAFELNLRHIEGGENVLCFNSARRGRLFTLNPGMHRAVLSVPSVPLRGGQYVWNVRVWDAQTSEILADTPFQYPMVIDDGGCMTGKLSLRHEWMVRPHPRHAHSAWPNTRQHDGKPLGEADETEHENLLVC